MSYPRYPAYKASGVEWLGEVPEHWDVLKLKRCVYLRSGDDITAEDISEEGQYPVYGGNGLRGYTGEFTHEGRYALIGRQGALCGNVNYADGRFWASEHAVVATPLFDISVTWLGELLRAMNLNQYSVSAAQPGLAVSVISNLEIPFPPLDEQRAIAAFLDRETAQIDALIAKLEDLIALLQEKRQALISHAVTKGLDPTVPMKDSGVEWLGEVPSHWEVWRNKRIYVEIDARSETGEEELLSVSHLTGVTPRSEKNVNMFMAETLEGYKLAEPGDLVINTMWAYMGALGFSPQAGTVSPSYNVYRLSPQHGASPEYLDVLYRTPQHITEIRKFSRGVWESRMRLYPDEFFDMRTPLPPKGEQEEIARFLRQEGETYSLIQNKCQVQIALLKERRAALITAAVSGAIDVR